MAWSFCRLERHNRLFAGLQVFQGDGAVGISRFQETRSLQRDVLPAAITTGNAVSGDLVLRTYRLHRPQSSSASRFTAGACGFSNGRPRRLLVTTHHLAIDQARPYLEIGSRPQRQAGSGSSSHFPSVRCNNPPLRQRRLPQTSTKQQHQSGGATESSRVKRHRRCRNIPLLRFRDWRGSVSV